MPIEPLEPRRHLAADVLPTVTLRAPFPAAIEGGDLGTFRLKRSGEHVGRILTVKLRWTGSAGAADVADRPISFTFAKNARTLDVRVSAVADGVDEPTETVLVTLAANGQPWRAGSPRSASMTIDDAPPPVDPPVDPTFTDISWSQAPIPSTVLSETTTAVVNDKLYAFGGHNDTFVSQKNVFRFDGTTWTALRDAPVALTNVAETEVGDKVYFAGGYVGNDNGSKTFGSTQVWIYDTTNDTWSNGPSLPEARASSELALVGRTLYHFGGETLGRTGDVATTWSLDLDNPSAGWITRAPMPLALNRVAVAVVGGKAYVLGGQTGANRTLVASDAIQVYDPATNAWTLATQRLPVPVSHTSQATFVRGGRIVMAGGEYAHNQPLNSVWSIDPETLVTTTLSVFPDARFAAAGGIVGDKLYLFGGYRGAIQNSAYAGTFR